MHQRWALACVVSLTMLACGGDDDAGAKSGTGGAAAGGAAGGAGSGGASGAATGGTGGVATGGAAGRAGTGGSGGGSGGSAGGGTGGSAAACDYQVAQNGVVVIEAESLTLSGQWQTATQRAGYLGTGYIEWTGTSQNNNPGQGLISVKIAIDQAGRYRFDWRNRIGMGTVTTEHNDTWVRFPDAGSYYGLKSPGSAESRRYPRPKCEDATFVAQIEALSTVNSAACPNGTSKDGWLKVYSSGASDWKWSAFTSDNDAHGVFVEFDSAGTYTLELSARGDFHLLDRIVLHREAVASATAQDATLSETSCP